MTVAEKTTVEKLASKVSRRYAELKKSGVERINFPQLLREIIAPEVPTDELRWYCSQVAQEIRRKNTHEKRETSLRINSNFLNQHFAGLPRGDRD